MMSDSKFQLEVGNEKLEFDQCFLQVTKTCSLVLKFGGQ